MQTLEAILAFAITMLILAMIASSMTEMVHRWLNLRPEGLRRMLDSMYDDVLSRYLPKEIAQAVDSKPGSDAAAVIDAFKELGPRALSALAHIDVEKPDPKVIVETLRRAASDDAASQEIRARIERAGESASTIAKAMAPILLKNKILDSLTENRVYTPIEAAKLALWSRWLSGGFLGTRIGKMTAEEFLQRLASGKLGEYIESHFRKLVNDGATNVDRIRSEFFEDLSRRFSSYGSEVSLWFQTRAKITSVIAGIVLAFVAHVDAFALIRVFTGNPGVAKAVIERYEAAATTRAEELLRQSSAAPTTPPTPATHEELRAETERRIARASTEIEGLRKLGAPIGWRFDGPPEQVNGIWFAFVPSWSIGIAFPSSILGFIGLVAGGFMIGLGAPFWYDVVKNLSNVRRLVGAVDDALTGDGPKRGKPTAQQQAAESLATMGLGSPPPPQVPTPRSEAEALFTRSGLNPTQRWGGGEPRTGGSF
jgi:hypothetical protein